MRTLQSHLHTMRYSGSMWEDIFNIKDHKGKVKPDGYLGLYVFLSIEKALLDELDAEEIIARLTQSFSEDKRLSLKTPNSSKNENGWHM